MTDDRIQQVSGISRQNAKDKTPNTQNPYATIAFPKPETQESMVQYFIYRRFVGDIMKGYLMVYICL
mgnify:CR=1 FL=1